MCSGRSGSVETPSYGSAMTVRPGLHIMDGNMVEMQLPQKVENLRAHDGLQPSGGAQVLHTKKVHANGLGAQDQSNLESQRIVDEMLVQERQAYGQNGEALAASSTAPEKKGFAEGPANGNTNGNSLRGAGSDEEQARVQLVVLVEELKAMDDLACFIDPVDDSFAPGYSKIILRPMSFSVMLRKAKNGEYLLVKDVLEDLELVCFNAMKYNAKRSKIYNAASLLLKKGKKHIRAFTQAFRPAELERKTDKRTTQMQPVSKIKTRREVAKEEEREEPALPGTLREELDIEGDMNGLGMNGGEAHGMERLEDRYEGSTCSSSYGDTASDSEEEWGFNPETSSRHRDAAMDEDGSEKRTLHPEWKKQRRGIEWRARWLEVRMADIQGKADRYNHLSRQLKARQQTHALRPSTLSESLQGDPPAPALLAQVPDANPGVPLPTAPQSRTTGQTTELAQAPSTATPNSEAPPVSELPTPTETAAPVLQGPPAIAAQAPGGAAIGQQVALSPPSPAGSQEPAVTAQSAASNMQTQPPGTTLPTGATGSLATDNLPLPPGDGEGLSSRLAAAPLSTSAAELVGQLAPVQGVGSRAARVDLGAVQLARDDEGGVSAQPGDTLVGRVKQSLRHQRKRKKVEDEPATEQLLATHPLLSRYDKASRKRPRIAGDDTVSEADVDLRSLSPGVEAPPERAPRPYIPPLPAVLEDEPMDLILEKIETLQQRLHVLRSQLNHSAANRIVPLRRLVPLVQTPRPLCGNPLPTPRPFASPRPSPTPSSRNTASPSPGARSILSPSPSGSPKADLERSRSANFSSVGGGGPRAVGVGGAFAAGRRRTADYDISNVVSSVAVGRKTVEQLQHTRIETPRWRLVQQTFDQLVGGDSSEEDTDDESYLRRHAPLEAQEKLRYMPPPSKHQGMGKPTGKGKEKPLSARGKPHQDGHSELVTPRSPSYKRRKVHGGKGENGSAKGKAKGTGMPPPGTKGKVKAEVLTSTAATEGVVKDGVGSTGSQEDVQKKRASLGLTIQIPDIH